MFKMLVIAWTDLQVAFRDRAALLLMLLAPFILTIGFGFVTGAFFVLGNAGIPAVDLGAPFLPGAQLVVSPDVVTFRKDLILEVGLPNDPSLVGSSFFAQAAPIYFTTIGLTTEVGITPGLVAKFL